MKHESSKSGLFLMELILAILFFALAGAICVRLFVAAHFISRDTREANRAAALAQSAAACVQAADGDLQEAAALLSAEAGQSGSVIVFYDADWQTAPADTAAYRMEIAPAASEQATVVLSRKNGDQIFSLAFSWHTPLIA